MEKPALVIMAKIPSSGGKSRLGSVLTPSQREELQWAFLEDVLDKAKQVQGLATFLAITPHEQGDEVSLKLGREVRIMAQPAGDLGFRMSSMAKQLFERGYGPVLIIGTDCPTLPPAYLVQAFNLLENQSMVFGPTSDGGYYLVGLAYSENRIFQGIHWSSSEVLQQTLASCQELNLTYGLLPLLRDIDVPADLLALQKTLAEGNPQASWFPRRTAKCMKDITL